MRKNLRQTADLLHLMQKTVGLVWQSAGYWMLLWFGLLVGQGMLPAATVLLTRSLVNGLVGMAGKGASVATWQPILPYALAFGMVLLLSELLKGAIEWVRTVQAELVQDHVSQLIHQQSGTIDFACYESAEYNDQLERAQQGSAERSLALLESLGTTVQNSVTLIAIAVILLPYGIVLPLVLLVSAIPTFLVILRTNQAQYQWSQRVTSDRRKVQYFNLLLTHSSIAAELRIFNLSPFFQATYRSLRQRLRHEQFQLIRHQSLSRFVAGLIALAISGMAVLWMGHQYLTGVIKLGDLALFYQAFNQGQTIIRGFLSSIGQIYRNSLYIRNLFDFLNLTPRLTDPSVPITAPITVEDGIRFHQVNFRYSGNNAPTLENFNLFIPAGKVIAIVGDNGAGKSTLIKLLCRLYDPDSGAIEIDGYDIRRLRIADLRRMITVLFQSPVTYHVSAGDNIRLGSWDMPEPTTAIETAARAAGIHQKIASLPQGYDSQLGKWFSGGTDLSGGEWQRLALARAFFRKAPIIILDEPTSAMDPWAEHDWLDRFRTMAMGKTSLVITHRFTLAMRADLIHVMRQGRIVETGTHQELLALNGLYAQSWRSQMQAESPGSAETTPEKGHPSTLPI